MPISTLSADHGYDPDEDDDDDDEKKLKRSTEYSNEDASKDSIRADRRSSNDAKRHAEGTHLEVDDSPREVATPRRLRTRR